MRNIAKEIIGTKIVGVSIAPMIVAGIIAFTSSAIMGSILMQPSDLELEAKEVVNLQYSSFLSKQAK